VVAVLKLMQDMTLAGLMSVWTNTGGN
jgi:hypothetical protein